MSARSVRRARQRQLGRAQRHRLGGRVAGGAGAALGATGLLAPGAEAATFTVTNLNDSGAGSLRQAAVDSNLNNQPDTIVFQAGLSGTINVGADINLLDQGVDVQGPGASLITLDGGGADNIFDLYDADAPGAQVRISGLTLTDGATGTLGGSGAVYQGTGGGAYAPDVVLDGVVISGNATTADGGGVRSVGGNLTITNSTISGNAAGTEGGGVYADDANVTIAGSTFTGNTAVDEGGGIHIADTAGAQATEVVISESAFTGNSSTGSYGGGIYLYEIDGAAVIERSVIAGNAAEQGAGLWIDRDVDAGVTVDASTISGNSAELDGGGVYVYAPDYAVLIQGSTVSDNYASSGGAGIYVEDDGDGFDALTVRNSTIAANRAGPDADATGAGIFRDSGAAVGDTVRLEGTIVADNVAPQDADLAQDEPAGLGSFAIAFSLIEERGNATITEDPAGSNLIGVDPLLGPLADNGGPTQTMLPALTSPALDAGAANGLATEQRGTQRTFDASNIANAAGGDATDIGATEQVAAGTCKGKAATVLFAPGSPITGSGANDVVVGTTGKDNVNTGGGKDTVCAAGGNDKVKGGAGKDNLNGQAGKDTLKGQGGKDKLQGGGGKDKLVGGPGKDKLKGGGGKDREIQ